MKSFAVVSLFIVGGLSLPGCDGAVSGSPALDPHAEKVDHLPRSLGDLGRKMRRRVRQLGGPDEAEVRSELMDLVTWAPEYAADTDLPESRWWEVYEASGSIRGGSDEWDSERVAAIERLANLCSEAWRTLPTNRRRDRFGVEGHSHDHGHGHSHDHGHEH